MDKGFTQGKMHSLLKPEDQRHPPLGQAALANLWGSVESDTESLAQERAHHKRHGHYDFLQNESADSLDEGSKKEETEDLQMYDSLEVRTHTHAKNKNPVLLQTEYSETQRDEREGRSLLSSDAYSDLRYDPNWRTNLKEAHRFNESPYNSVEALYNNSKDTSAQSHGDRKGQVIKGGYVVVTSPAPVVTPHLAGFESDRPYCLHPQNDAVSSAEANVSVPCSSSTKDESHKTQQRTFREKGENSCDKTDENTGWPELTEGLQSMHIQEYPQQRLRHTQGAQQRSTSPLRSPKTFSNKKPESLMEDIVERNKVTLGRIASKSGSYLKAHALKQEIPHHVKKVSQVSKGKKAEQKEYPNPSGKQQPPVPEIKTEHEDRLGSPLAGNPAVVTSLQPFSPAIHLNIHLNSPSHFLPLLQQTGQDAIINLAGLHGHRHWSPASEAALSPRKSSFISPDRMHTQLQHHILEFSPAQWQRTTASQWPSASEGEDQTGRQNEVHTKRFAQNLFRTPTSTSSQPSRPNLVLPPIGKSVMRKGPEGTSGQSVEHIHRSSFDGYLGQMKKEKQMKARVTYKVSILKDYKQLRSDIKLQGLGPDYSAMEKTKLYSNLIREQNKTISRIPFPPTKDPEGNDMKVPRMKALEYAKTIVKPPVQPKPKQTKKHQAEDFTGHAPFLHGLDMSQLATLELLRQRHEEERQAVALFRKVHAV
ncbi:jhy protein homolog [Parambassis ranga]|uniref:Jhy protein homolog n=1 Tax=Parambassis ranga TaxID=210632 RepID=A0A6P7JM89_9TELE|nr:jhy protein homolog [Parambassis ranga]